MFEYVCLEERAFLEFRSIFNKMNDKYAGNLIIRKEQ